MGKTENIKLQEKLQHLFKDENFMKELLSKNNTKEVETLFRNKGIDLKDEEVNFLGKVIAKAIENKGKMSDKDLLKIAGGSTQSEKAGVLIGALLGGTMGGVVSGFAADSAIVFAANKYSPELLDYNSGYGAEAVESGRIAADTGVAGVGVMVGAVTGAKFGKWLAGYFEK